MNYGKFFAQPWFPGLAVLMLFALLMFFDPSSVAIFLGTGAGSMVSPFVLVGVILLGIAARRSWHSVIGMTLVAAVHRMFFTNPIGERAPGWDVLAGIGSFTVGLLLISLISAATRFFARRSRNSEARAGNEITG